MGSSINPLFDFDGHYDDSSSASSTATRNTNASALAPSTATLQTMNIKSHVPVVLDISEPNHLEWRSFMDSVIGKFGLGSHIASSPSPTRRRDPEWIMIDQCLIS